MFGPLSRWELSQALEPLLNQRSGRHQQEKAIRTPFGIEHLGGDVRVLEGIAPQVEKLREPQGHKRLLPRIYSFPALLHEVDLPVAVAERHEVTFVTPIEDSRARILLHLTRQEWNEVVSVEMDLEGLGASLVAFLNFLDDIRLARRCQQRWQHVLVREDVVGDCARLDDARPPDGTRQAPSQFVSFSPRNGVVPPSGQLSSSAPLSVEYITMVLLAIPSSSSLARSRPT